MAFYSLLSHLQTLSPLPSAAIQEHPTQLQHPPGDRLHPRITLLFFFKMIQMLHRATAIQFTNYTLDRVHGKGVFDSYF